jgi:hypothetical protein
MGVLHTEARVAVAAVGCAFTRNSVAALLFAESDNSVLLSNTTFSENGRDVWLVREGAPPFSHVYTDSGASDIEVASCFPSLVFGCMSPGTAAVSAAGVTRPLAAGRGAFLSADDADFLQLQRVRASNERVRFSACCART